MRFLKQVPICLAMISVLQTHIVQSQELQQANPCLRLIANKIRANDWIRLRVKDSTIVEGQFQLVDEKTKEFIIRVEIDSTDATPYTQIDRRVWYGFVSQLEYKKRPGGFSWGWAAYVFLSTTAYTTQIYYACVDCGSQNANNIVALSIGLGALAGWIMPKLGSGSPFPFRSRSKTVKVDCP